MGLLTTNLPDLFFEDTPVGHMYKELWEADDAAIDAVLDDYWHPFAVRVGQAGQLHPDHHPRPAREGAPRERRGAHPRRLHREPRPPDRERHGHAVRESPL